MPDAEPAATRSGRLLTGLFWFGVGLSPLAALLLLFGGGGGLRVAGVLAVLAVVLIGLSIALRPDPSTLRLQLEETLLEEIDALREDVREEIATASREAHQSFGERIGAVRQQVEAMRAERAALPAAGSAAVPAGPAGVAAPIGRAQLPPPPSVAPPYSVTPSQATPVRSAAPAPRYPAGPQAPPVSGAAAPPMGRQQPVSAPAGNGRASVPGPGAGRGGNGALPARQSAEPPRRSAAGRGDPGAGYRRTETVQVTRSTYVEPPPRDRLYDTGHQSRYDDSQEWSPPVPRGRRGREVPEESWTDQKLRERYGGRSNTDANGEDSWGAEDQRWQPVSGAPVSGEIITGEPVSAEPRRRRSHRWEDEDSTGHRISERWAAARGDDGGGRHSGNGRPDYGGADYGRSGYPANGYGGNGYGGNGYGGNGYGGNGNGHGRPDYARPALPAGREASGESTWNDSWDEPAPSRNGRGHRYRDDDGDAGRGYTAPRQRRLDFELSDERWR